MSELLTELEQKRDTLQKEAELYKERRDALNNETKKWAEKRDEFNDKAREMQEKAEEHRKKRDEYNDEVRRAKIIREELGRKISNLHTKIKQLKKKHTPKIGENLDKLKRELRELEFKQMTTVLSAEDEKKVVKILKGLHAKIQEKEKKLEEVAEIKDAIMQLRNLEKEADETHKKVEEFADLAEIEHQEMGKAFNLADNFRNEADNCQEELIKSKLIADEEHKKFIDTVALIHDHEKIISGLKKKIREEKKTKEVDNTKKHAQDLYNRLLKGEKLTTEEFMAIQRAGLL